eukprot:TRINITY_DN4619_c0_g1_i3.p3 TRINITY_DN4619_c0_g1~~TRINITY_DN4619_c0_g1_i3.p3  ORF type:complete len:123 (-),score=3.05 TRINITY_DN4619_c0_g1_i3:812-1180(-)
MQRIAGPATSSNHNVSKHQTGLLPRQHTQQATMCMRGDEGKMVIDLATATMRSAMYCVARPLHETFAARNPAYATHECIPKLTVKHGCAAVTRHYNHYHRCPALQNKHAQCTCAMHDSRSAV